MERISWVCGYGARVCVSDGLCLGAQGERRQRTDKCDIQSEEEQAKETEK